MLETDDRAEPPGGDAALGGDGVPGGHRAGAGDRAAFPVRAGTAVRASCRWRRWRCASALGVALAAAPASAAAPVWRAGRRGGRRWCWPDGRCRGRSPCRAWRTPRATGRACRAPSAPRWRSRAWWSRRSPRRPARPAARALATAAAVLVAMAAGRLASVLVALGPGAAGGEQALAAGAHVHAGHRRPRTAIEYQPGSGREGGHYVVSVASPRAPDAARAGARRSPRRWSSPRAPSGTCAGARAPDAPMAPPAWRTGWHERRPPDARLRAGRAGRARRERAARRSAHATLVGSTPRGAARGVSEDARLGGAAVLRAGPDPQPLRRERRGPRGHRVDTGAPRTATGDPRRVIIPLRTPLAARQLHGPLPRRLGRLARRRLGVRVRRRQGGAARADPRRRRRPVGHQPGRGRRARGRARRARAAARPARLPRARLGPGGRRRRAACRAAEREARCATGSAAVLACVLGARDPRRPRRDGRARGQERGRLPHRPARAALHPADAYRLVAASRFGDLLGWRCGALRRARRDRVRVWNTETADAPSAGRRGPLALMALLGVAALTLLAEPGPRLAGAAGAAVGRRRRRAPGGRGDLDRRAALPGRGPVRAPRALPEAGRTLASATLARFSRVALWSVVVIAVTGLAPDGRRAVLARRSCGAPATAATCCSRPRCCSRSSCSPGATAASWPPSPTAGRRAPPGCARSRAACRWSWRSPWASSPSRRVLVAQIPGRG